MKNLEEMGKEGETGCCHPTSLLVSKKLFFQVAQPSLSSFTGSRHAPFQKYPEISLWLLTSKDQQYPCGVLHTFNDSKPL